MLQGGRRTLTTSRRCNDKLANIAPTRIGLLPGPWAVSANAAKDPTLYAALLKRPPRLTDTAWSSGVTVIVTGVGALATG